MAHLNSRGIRNNNPLNIRISNNKWRGKIKPSQDPSFEQFESMVMGIRAAMVCLRTHCRRLVQSRRATTVKNLISIWAPSTENDTHSYVKLVCSFSGGVLMPNSIVDPGNKGLFCLLVRSMAHVETGCCMNESLFTDAYNLL